MRHKLGLHLGSLAFATLAAAMSALPAAAQEEAEEGSELIEGLTERLDAVAETIPDRDFYPEGYRDLRIVAYSDYEEQSAQWKRDQEQWRLENPDDANLYEQEDDPKLDIYGCPYEDADTDDPDEARLIYLAVDISMLEVHLRDGGYDPSFYADLLIEFERKRIELLDADEAELDEQVSVMTEYGSLELGKLSAAYWELANAINARLDAAGSPLPRMTVDGGCGAGGGEGFEIATLPAQGQVWLISAFNFRVCARRNPDPWDKFGCRWNEIDTSQEQYSLGRFIYEVRWPDGTVRRGTREIGYGETVTFRKTGS